MCDPDDRISIIRMPEARKTVWKLIDETSSNFPPRVELTGQDKFLNCESVPHL